MHFLRQLSHAAGAVLAIANTAYGARPTATLKTQGVVVGTTTMLPGMTAAVNYYGSVPYALTPPERFAPPEPAPAFSGPFNAVTTSPSCLQEFSFKGGQARERAQSIFYFPAGPTKKESEDCLYTNIYTPPGTTSSSKLPVLVYLFGGDQAFGGGGFHYWDGTTMAYNQGIIFVSFSRRTNVFGFPASPEIPNDQNNVGFLDIRMAVEWIHENIEAFGGDPDAITINGESSGATDAKMLLALPPAPLPFRGVIMQSEASSNIGDGNRSWPKLTKALGCSSAKSPLACVKTKPAKKIQSIIEHHSLGFPPAIDGKTYVLDTRPFVAAGTSAQVPFLIGTDADEGRPFVYDDGLANNNELLIDFLVGFLPGAKKELNAIGPLTGPLAPPTYESASKVITDLLFVCRASSIVRYYQQHGYTAFRYMYDAKFPNQATFPNPGVYHSSEIPIIYGTYQNAGATAEQKTLSLFLQKTWADFVKDPTSGPGFPAYGSGAGNLGVFTADKNLTVQSGFLYDTESMCEIYDPIIAPRGF